jgi:hypothetical protein
MGRRPISSDEKTLDGECRANMAGVRTCFSGESHGPAAHQSG